MPATRVKRKPPASKARRRSQRIGQTKQLSDLANIGPAMLQDFEVLGIRTIKQLARRGPLGLYRTLCRKTGVRHDPCVLDTFMAAVAEARGGRPTPWWKFTARRKARHPNL